MGEVSAMIPRKKITEISREMFEAPYALGGMDKREGFDCISYLYFFYRELGAEIPEEEGGFDVQNYAEKYQENPGKAKRALLRYILKIGEPVQIEFMQAGDLAIFRKDGEVTTAIFLGSGKFLSCDERAGVIIIPRRSLTFDRMEARRPCLRLCQ